jgi:signal transduction histidine kinase
MSTRRVPFRVAFAGSVLVLLLFAAAATAGGYVVEAHHQQADRDHRLATAEAYANHAASSLRQGLAPAEAQRFQQAMAGKLAGFGVGAQLTLISPTGKRLLYASSPAAAQQAAESYTFPLAPESRTALMLDLYRPPADRTRPLLVALVFGLGALLAVSMLLIWAASRWLVAPLRRLNVQVDAIAGGDRIETQASSPIHEVNNVAAAVAGMAARLMQTAEQDARAEVERGLLVSSIAHDLRTPLFALRGYLAAIAAGIGNPAERLDGARAKADQIDRLVTRLFDYARAEIEERPPLAATDLAVAVSDTTAAFEFAAAERDVQLRVSIGAAPTAAIDRDGFERALANVIDNALQHTPRGGTVDVDCGEDAEGAFVRVVDDGPGIAPDLLPRIFEPMARADRARNSRGGGAGLGLAIATRLLGNQGGTIRAANAPERGAMITIRVPWTSA